MEKQYQVGYFEGAANTSFQPLREFANEEEARNYIQLNYYEGEPQNQPQNIAIIYNSHIIFDGRIAQLN